MIYSFMYVLVFSFSAVLVEKLYLSVSPLFSLLFAAAIATAFFNIVNIGRLKETYAKFWQEKKACFGIMVIILVMWNCTMTAPGLIGASLSNFLYFAWLGALGLLISSKNDRNKLYAGLFVLLLMIFVISSHLLQKPSTHVLLGMILALIGGTTTYIYFKQSQSLIRKVTLSATQILAFRFYLTIFILSIALPKGSFPLYATKGNFLEITLLAITGLIVPLYFQQKALERISSEQNAIFTSLSPVLIAFLQELMFKNVDLRYTIIYLLYTLTISFPYFLKIFKKEGSKI